MLHHSKLDKYFWAEAAMTAIYVKNRLPSPKVVHKTPLEIVYSSKPSVKHMRAFGCPTYILTPKENRLKWDPKARVGIFVGYEEVSKSYRVYDIKAGKVVISRDVNFDESTFGLPPRSLMKMPMTWTSNCLTSMMKCRVRWSTSK
uniref:Retroviral polymerase SH3-like domain-containing protein n=1 Tax=Peronospora matthiolae TaxID=2874970 RepID=A0AAV1VFH3_9STRA